MRLLPAFWQALDDIPGATTDTMEWRRRLGDEFVRVGRYLRNTGELAREVDCPSPGGDGCPRRVIRQPGDRWRAVCGSQDHRCDALDLTQADIAVLALDRTKLTADLTRAFALTAAPSTPGRRRVIDLGVHEIVAGLGAPAFLLLPGSQDSLTLDDLQAVGVPAGDAILLTPCRGSLPAALRGRLATAGHHLVHLSDVAGVDNGGGLGLVQPVEPLLDPIRTRLRERLGQKPGGPIVLLPPGMRWEQVTLTFKSSAELECVARGVAARITPGQVGMENERTQEETKAWAMLLVLARENGRLPRGQVEQWENVKKQKQELSRHLQRIFGISEEPIPWDKKEKAYVCRFVLRDERPLTERRQEAARRNFAD